MKKLFLFSILLFAVGAQAQAPTKQFDVRNGNGIVDGGNTQAQALYVVFKDAAAKTEAIDAICSQGNYDALNPATRPTKAQFAMREITFFLREKVKAHREAVERAKLITPTTDDLP